MAEGKDVRRTLSSELTESKTEDGKIPTDPLRLLVEVSNGKRKLGHTHSVKMLNYRLQFSCNCAYNDRFQHRS